MSRLEDMLDKSCRAKIFSKLDMWSGYYQMQIRLGDDCKMTFKTREGLYEWKVMPFGLCNVSSIFTRLMNEIIKTFLGVLYIVYFDDIIVYNTIQHRSKFFEVLRAYKLYLNILKCLITTSCISLDLVYQDLKFKWICVKYQLY